MTATSRPHRSWEKLRGLPGHTPLRVKMLTALLSLVAIALIFISVVGVAVFRSYQLNRANDQVTNLFWSEISLLKNHPMHGPPNFVDPLGPYLLAVVAQGSSLQSQAAQQGFSSTTSLPDVPTSASWLAANQNKVVNVPAISGGDNWQVITTKITITTSDFLGQSSQSATLIAGVDLGDINGTIGQLSRIDALVSLAIILALAVVGIAIVRSSLRPLRDIEQTAEAIAAGDLSRRVPDRDPHTEVGLLGRSLNTMLAQIESSFDARSRSEAAARRSEERMRQFVADASHELRTPLTAMRGYAEYYRQRGGIQDEDAPAANGTHANGGGQLSRADLDRIMQRVEQESARMGVLVEDMLLLARLDQQRPIERRPVRPAHPGRGRGPGRADHRPGPGDRPERGLGGRLPGARRRGAAAPGHRQPDEQRAEPHPGRHCHLAAHPGRPRRPVPSVVLEVADQGPGMSPEQAEHVFERFYRGDQARTRKAGGTGLGLAIVAALVAAHGGTVTLDTAPGQGATFRITLPLAPEAQRDDTDQGADEIGGDDEPRSPGTALADPPRTGRSGG